MATTHFAVLGDLHSNGPALDACLAEIDEHGIRDGLCTGDLVMRGAWPAHCVATIRKRGWPCAVGNTDRKVVRATDEKRLRDKSSKVGNRWWTRTQLSTRQLDFLADLPLVVRVDAAGKRIAVVHGIPDDPVPPFGEESSDDELEAIADQLAADCVISGHTHRAFVRRVGDRLFLNPGSVGESRTDDLRPAWARLLVGPDGFDVHLERVDQELAVHRP